jgi:hypothetical protein
VLRKRCDFLRRRKTVQSCTYKSTANSAVVDSYAVTYNEMSSILQYQDLYCTVFLLRRKSHRFLNTEHHSLHRCITTTNATVCSTRDHLCSVINTANVLCHLIYARKMYMGARKDSSWPLRNLTLMAGILMATYTQQHGFEH